MRLVFVYGTLQHQPLLERLLGRVPASTPAHAPGHRAACLAGRVYPGLVVDEEASAAGSALELTDNEVRLLDQFEGPEYHRRTVTVTSRGGHASPAEVWMLGERVRHLATPRTWDLNVFVDRHGEEFLRRSVAGHRHPGAAALPAPNDQ